MARELTEAELLVLNNLVYREELYNTRGGAFIYKDKTIGELLEKNILGTSESQKMGADEWNEIYKMASSNAEICNYKIKSIYKDEKTGAKMVEFCNSDSDTNNNTGQYVVVYAGTGANEWRDDTVAGNEADSIQQQQAKSWYDSLKLTDKDNVVVTGHSKGGNKAMYVSVLESTVDRCVAFDGEGFSKQFLEKYQEEIKKSTSKISLRASFRDYVNILLYSLPGIDIKYTTNTTEVGGVEEYHCPNALFYYDKDGNIQCDLGELADENDPVMEFLHDYVIYILENAPEGEKTVLLSYLGELLTSVLGGDDAVPREDIMDQFQNTGAVIAAKYLKEFADKYKKEHPVKYAKIQAYLLKMMYEHYGLSGARLDYVLTYILHFLNSETNIVDGLLYFSGTGIGDYFFDTKETTIRDFSNSTIQMLLDVTKEKDDAPWWDVTSWDCWYRIEDFFGGLSLNNYAANVDDYYRKIIDINDASLTDMQSMFDEVYSIDSNYSGKLSDNIGKINDLADKIKAFT